MIEKKRKVEQLIARKREISEQLKVAEGELFPIGSIVCFDKFGGSITAEIVAHRWLHDFEVRNIHTKKQYCVRLFDIAPDLF